MVSVPLTYWSASPLYSSWRRSQGCQGGAQLWEKVNWGGGVPHGMRLFCLQLEASCLHWSFLLTVDKFSFFTYNWSFFAYNLSFSTYNWSFFAYSGEARLIRALRDCKQRSLTVSKKSSDCKWTSFPRSKPGGFHIFGKGLDCVPDPFENVPSRL